MTRGHGKLAEGRGPGHDHGGAEHLCPESVQWAVITAQDPKTLGKQYWLEKDGSLQKRTIAYMTEGRAKCFQGSGLEEFARQIPSLKKNQAVTYGLPEADDVGLVTEEEWRKMGRPSDPQPRTQEHFAWPHGPGIMLVDYDPAEGAEVLSSEELVEHLRKAVPGLKTARMLWWTSSSSHIFHGEKDLTGLKGQRVYLIVQDAADIPRAGKALIEYLWAAGFGRIEIGRAGQLLERTLVDGSVWQTNRLDFAAGADCLQPLQQRRGTPVIIPGDTEIIDSAVAIPEPSEEVLANARARRAQERARVRGESEKVKQAYIDERAREMCGESAEEPAFEQARATVRRALENQTLSGDFMIDVIIEGVSHRVSVRDLLDDPVRYDGLKTFDPIEREYDDGRPVGKLFLLGARQNLFSFAHGGRNYRLILQPQHVELVQGRQHDAVVETLSLLRRSPDVYDFGDALVLVDDGRLYPLDEHALKHYLGGVVQYWQLRKGPSGSQFKVLVDPPSQICKQILSLRNRRKLQQLRAVTTVPTLRIDGSILNRPGYDAETGLLLELGTPLHIPEHPTREQCLEALGRLMRPFKDFPLASSIDWGVLLAALLTAPLRPVLPTAPAFGIDASVQASGKTLLAKCLSIIVTGQEPKIWPYVQGRDDEENRKRIFTALWGGDRAIVWDNLVGVFDSAALAAALTAETFTDRVLGRSESQTVPSKAMFMLTGNNMTLKGDMPRRVPICRIEPSTEMPFARQFDLDPEDYCKRHREEMVEAALTLVRGWLSQSSSADGHRAPGRMGSFEVWDDLVRQTVAWVGRELKPGQYADPMEAMKDLQASDPEREALGVFLKAWFDCFGTKFVSSQEVLDAINEFDNMDKSPVRDGLAAAFQELFGSHPGSSKAVGKFLQFRKGRVVGGMKLVCRKDGKANTMKWAVDTSAEVAAPGLPGLPGLNDPQNITKEIFYSNIEGVNKPGKSGKPGDTGLASEDDIDISEFA